MAAAFFDASSKVPAVGIAQDHDQAMIGGESCNHRVEAVDSTAVADHANVLFGATQSPVLNLPAVGIFRGITGTRRAIHLVAGLEHHVERSRGNVLLCVVVCIKYDNV